MRAKLASLNHCAVPFLSAPPTTCVVTTVLTSLQSGDVVKREGTNEVSDFRTVISCNIH